MTMLQDCRQDTDFSCGPTIAKSVLLRFGYSVRKANELVATIPCSEAAGTRPDDLEHFFRREGFYVLLGEMNLSDLHHFTKHGRPVICAVKDHWVGVDEVKRRLVSLQDPAEGRRILTFKQFEEIWVDEGRWGDRYRQFGICVWQ